MLTRRGGRARAIGRVSRYKAAKEAGKLRAEGKAYVVEEGDVFNFKFR